MLAHAVLYVAMSLIVQALMITVGVTTNWLVGPFGIEATLANLLIGGLVVMRLTFTSFALPRATVVPVTRRRWPWDSIVAGCALLSAVALLVVGYAFLSEPSNLTTAWQVFLPLYAVCLLLTIMLVPLWLLWWASRRLPAPDHRRPRVDVIIPAYNEEENIARLLRSIDVAAERYGGPVWVVVSNDGSVDRTEQIAQAEVAAFRSRPRPGADRAERRPVRRAEPRARGHQRRHLRPRRRGLRDGRGRAGLLGPLVPRPGDRHGRRDGGATTGHGDLVPPDAHP